jgi:hypothetical protein
MSDIRNKLQKAIDGTKGEAFWEDKAGNVRSVLSEFFEFKFLDEIEASELLIKEIKKEDNLMEHEVRIPSFAVEFKIKANKENDKWYYEFVSLKQGQAIVPSSALIDEDMKMMINGFKCVIFAFEHAGYGLQLYAIPSDIASNLCIPDFDNKEISENEPFLSKIEQYKVPFFSSYNCN